MAASLPVVIASDQASIPVAATLAAETTKVIGTVNIAAGQSIAVTSAALTSIDSKIPALGQALAAASVPVVLTAAQLTTLTPPAAITGFLTESDFDTKVGSLTEAAPATDTASSGLNGRLQRIAQRITSLIALVPASLGQKTMANSFAVTIASDQSALPVTDNGGTLTVDAPVGTPVFVRLSDGAAAISTLPVSLASVPSHAVTNAGTFAVQVNGAALTALQLIDDIVHASDAALGKVAAIGAQFDDVSPGTTTENNVRPLRMSTRRELYVQLRDAAGNERGLNIDSNGAIAITVASLPSHAVTNAGTFAVQPAGSIAHDGGAAAVNPVLGGGFASAAAPADVSADNDAVRAWFLRNGAQATVLTAAGALIGGDAANGLDVDVTRLPSLPAGSNAIGKLAANAGVTIGAVEIAASQTIAVTNAGTFAVQATAVGTVADDGTTPGAPVMIGGQAKETDGTDPGSVSAEDDVVRAIFDRNRRQLVNNVHPNHFVLFEDHTSAQTNNQLKAAPGANLSIYITDVIFSNGATAGSIKLVEDEGGTPVQIGSTVYMAVNGGAVMNFVTPKRLTANKSLGFTSTTVTTHSVEIHGYIAP